MLAELEAGLPRVAETRPGNSGFRARLPARSRRSEKAMDLNVFRKPGHAKFSGSLGLWLSEDTLRRLSRKRVPAAWWWLPPVIWPDGAEEIINLVGLARKKGARIFVLNAPWQITFFKDPQKLYLWAGPFCNLTNALALKALKSLGFSGAIVSPELGRNGYLQLARQRPFALGMVVSGNWPLCVSRTKAQALNINEPFTSPRGEAAWLARYGRDYWMFPNWRLDLLAHQNELKKAGYSLFVHLNEPMPKKVKLKRRPGLWNWNLDLK
jgi:putative protease